MKRFASILLLIVLLAASLPANAESIEEILLAEPWISGTGETLRLNPDGSGTMTQKWKTAKGKWRVTQGELVVFTYQQSNKKNVSEAFYFYSKSADGNYYLYPEDAGDLRRFYQSSVLNEKKEKSKNRQYLKWGENVSLKFVSFKLDAAIICRNENELLSDYAYYSKHRGGDLAVFEVKKNIKYLCVTGTMKNGTSAGQNLPNTIRAKLILDGKRAYEAEIATTKKNTVFEDVIEKEKTQKVFIYAAIPVSVLDSAKTAELRLSFYEGFEAPDSLFEKRPEYDFEGDYFYGVKISDSKMASIKKTPKKKKTNFKEKSKMPMPDSFVDVCLTSRTKTKDNNVSVYQYQFTRKYSDGESAKQMLNRYVSQLKKEGLKVTLVRGTYKVFDGKKQIASMWNGGNLYTFMVNVVIQ